MGHTLDVAVIRYHVWWPGINDPFYQANISENTARTNFYGITGVPGGRTDGQDIGFGEGAVAQRLAVSSPLTISLTGTYNSGNRQGSVRAHVVNTSTGTVSGTLHFVVTENGIPYTAPNGERIFNNVMRDMLPDANGQSISVPAGGTLDTARAFTLGSGWVADSCNLVVFVQGSGNQTYQAAKMYIPPDRSFLAFRADSTRDSVGNLNGYLQPGETGNYFVSIVNMNPATATGVSATIASTDTFITILTGSATYPDIPGNTAFRYNSTPFVIRVKPTCPYGRWVPVTLTITATTDYTVSRTFRLGVGAPNDYIGRDTYGYYAYENLDTRFAQSPPYSWVEINPNRGGPGALLTMGDDQVITQTVPFSMRHYGTNSTTLSVCSNGWLAVGSFTTAVNQPEELPTVNGATGMIAAYWCDLDPASTGGGRVAYYNDATNHRYIVEFDSVQIYTGTSNGRPQTFQYILRDPAYYPTPTGDMEIILQYRVLNGPVSGTIGIQNNARNVATNYFFPVANPATYGPANGRAIKFTTVLPTSGVEAPPGSLQPETPFALYGSWPNPFRGGTTINFSLPREGQARLAVYNVAGQLVRTLHDGVLPAGSQSVSWDGRNQAGRSVPGGVYFYRLSTGDRTLTHKTVLVR